MLRERNDTHVGSVFADTLGKRSIFRKLANKRQQDAEKSDLQQKSPDTKYPDLSDLYSSMK